MLKVTVSIQATYKMTKQVQEEYLSWLDDYRDSKKMREAFFTDRFIHPDFFKFITDNPYLLDYKNAKITYKEDN